MFFLILMLIMAIIFVVIIVFVIYNIKCIEVDNKIIEVVKDETKNSCVGYILNFNLNV